MLHACTRAHKALTISNPTLQTPIVIYTHQVHATTCGLETMFRFKLSPSQVCNLDPGDCQILEVGLTRHAPLVISNHALQVLVIRVAQQVHA